MLKRELSHMTEFSERSGASLSSIFFGGGTPSLMRAETMAKLIDHAQDLFEFSDDIEITMEANPTSVEAKKLGAFRKAGANRLSLGMQSLEPEALAFLGREHSVDEALSALAMAQNCFERISADFIYARPKQNLEEWAGELNRILSLGLDHLSLYQLTLEAGTAFYQQHQQGLFDPLDPDLGRELFDLTQDLTSEAGLFAYEISNHARPKQESRHNLIYWRAGDWLGIGPGAYGRFWHKSQRIEVRSRRDPAAWLDDVARQNHAIDQINTESPIGAFEEVMMMGLRLTQGVDLTQLKSQQKKWLNLEAVAQLHHDGMIKQTGEQIMLTPAGRPLINSILTKILAA